MDRREHTTVKGHVTDMRGTLVLRTFQGRLDRAVIKACRAANPARILDIGCAEGELTLQLAELLPDAEVTGLDLEDEGLQAEWATRRRSNLRFVTASATDLPFEDKSVDVVTAVEALEHIADWEDALTEVTRVCAGTVIASVPQEPLWRMLNMARGKYWSNRGNTPGHVNHWSPSDFRRLMGQRFIVRRSRRIFPWTFVIADMKQRMAQAGRDLDALSR